jgi:diguanylate cyclase (GGDEF)-like protein
MNQTLKWKYLAVVLLLVMLSIFVRVVYDKYQHEQQFEREINVLSESTNLFFNDLIVGLKDKYMTLTQHYANEALIRQAMTERDRQTLFNYVVNDYLYLKKQDPNLHTMHFIDANNRTVLRMHQPKLFDDDLTSIRPIVRDANATQQALQAFEVGRNGITYRITTPMISSQGQHLGLLEFGIRPNYFVERIEQRFAIESAVLVKTTSLGRLLKPHTFDEVKGLDFSIIQATPIFEQLFAQVDLRHQRQVIEYEGKSYLVMTNLDQVNHQGEVVAKVLIAKDITELRERMNQDLLSENALNLLVLLFLCAVIYVMFSRYSRALAASYDTIAALHVQSSQLKNQANTDELTGLYNRRFFNESLQTALGLKQHGSLLFFDIDNFKQINDHYGHRKGDQVLVDLAHMLESFFRHDDLIVRWGGEEFAVFINGMEEADAFKKAEKFRHYVEHASKTHLSLPFTLSGGVSEIQAEDTVDSLIHRADQFLYFAKMHGRNKIIAAQHLHSGLN